MGQHSEIKQHSKNNNLIVSLALAMFFWEKAPASSLLKLSILLGGGLTCYFSSKAYGYFFYSQQEETRRISQGLNACELDQKITPKDLLLSKFGYK